jgi:hypothetical protein
VLDQQSVVAKERRNVLSVGAARNVLALVRSVETGAVVDVGMQEQGEIAEHQPAAYAKVLPIVARGEGL